MIWSVSTSARSRTDTPPSMTSIGLKVCLRFHF